MKNRMLREGFFKSDKLAECPYEARLLYAGLWCLADREGRFHWRPKVIKAEIFPYDTVEINSLLNSLLENNFIRRYQVEGEVYGDIPTFRNHQNIHPHEAKSRIPEFQMSLDVITCNDISVTCNEMYGRLEVQVQVEEGSSKGRGSKSGSGGGSLLPLPPAVVEPENQKPQGEERSPLWAGCTWFRLSEKDLVLAQDHYRKTGIGPEVIPFTIIEVENWLCTNSAKAKLARNSKTHLRQLYASWAVERGVKLWQASTPTQNAVVGQIRGSGMYQTASEKTTSLLLREAARAKKLDEMEAKNGHESTRHTSITDNNKAVLGFFSDTRIGGKSVGRG